MSPTSELSEPEPEFRKAAEADHGIVLALIREYYAYDEIPFREREMARGLHALLRESTMGEAFLILSRGTRAGYLIWTFGYDLEFGGRQATVTDIYLRPDFRRLGLGRKAFRMLEARAAEMKVVALQLQPEQDNTEALAFYQRLGFRAHTRVSLSKRLT